MTITERVEVIGRTVRANTNIADHDYNLIMEKVTEQLQAAVEEATAYLNRDQRADYLKDLEDADKGSE